MRRLILLALLLLLGLAPVTGCDCGEPQPVRKTGRAFDRAPQPAPPKRP